MKTRLLRRISSSRGNVIIMLALTLSGVLAVAAVVIDTTLYLMRRQEVQALAESVATGAALNLPQSYYADTQAKQWYDQLRVQDGHVIAPDRTADSNALTITFDDNQGETDEVIPYRVSSITVKVTATYTTNLLRIPGITKSTISVVGQATAQLKPTDIVLIIENSSSLYEIINDDNAATNPFKDYFFNKLHRVYAGQCFNDTLREFKEGAISLYDILSQVNTYRVSVIHTSSRTGEPLMTAQLGENVIAGSSLEYQSDQPDYPSTRCMLGTSYDAWAVPGPLSAKGELWSGRSDLSSLVLANRDAFDYSVSGDAEIGVREAIWIKSVGRGVRSLRYQNPTTYYTDPSKAIDLAESILQNSRRADGKPVAARMIIYLTDGAGARMGTAPDAETITPRELCEAVQARPNMSAIKFGLIYFGHREDLEFHGWDPDDTYSYSDEMRNYCLAKGSSTSGMFFAEASPASGVTESNFKYVTIPTIAHAIKGVELLE